MRRTNRTTGDDLASILLVRSCKLLVHETCHLLGMEHCIYLNCCMNGSGHLEEDFEQSMFLCPIDLKKLALIVDFDLVERYKQMREFFDKHNAPKESEWLTNVINTLEDMRNNNSNANNSGSSTNNELVKCCSSSS